MEIKQRIEQAMNAAGFTQTTLSKQLNISQQAVHQWVKGETIPSHNSLRKLANLLGVDLNWLVFGSGQGVSDSKTLYTVASTESNAEWLGTLDAWDSKTPLSDDEVALPFFREVKLSAGNGSTEVQENHGCKLRFSLATLKRQGVQADSAYCVTVKGNSMEPVLPSGCTVGIDTSKKTIVNGDWYAIDHHGELRVKVMYRLPGGGYRLRSFNSDEYPDEYPVAEQDVRILGRVFWWSGLRLFIDISII